MFPEHKPHFLFRTVVGRWLLLASRSRFAARKVDVCYYICLGEYENDHWLAFSVTVGVFRNWQKSVRELVLGHFEIEIEHFLRLDGQLKRFEGHAASDTTADLDGQDAFPDAGVDEKDAKHIFARHVAK